jgi:hypothetical protein
MRIRLALACVLATSALVVLLLPAPRARAQTAGALIGTATATGARGTYTVPNFLIVSTIFDGGGPISQAVLNTSGDATGFGSLPYPGDTVVNAPGLLSVATGKAIPFSYPFYVQATAPTTPVASASDPTGQLSLKATATDALASGVAGMGTGASPSSALSTSSVKTDDSGTVTAVADAAVHGINLNGVLKIASVTSHAESVLGPSDSKPTSKASTTVEGVTVAGLAVLVGPNGIGLPGQSVATQPVVDALNAVLKQAGLGLKTVTNQAIAGGLATSGLEITQTGVLPLPGSPTGTMVFDLASTSASVVSGTGAGRTSAQPAPQAPSSATSDFGTTADSPGAPAPAGDSGSTLAAVPSTGAAPARTGGLPQQSAVEAPQLLARDLRSTFRLLYVVAAVGAALLLAGSALWRNRGVRVTWIPER